MVGSNMDRGAFANLANRAYKRIKDSEEGSDLCGILEAVRGGRFYGDLPVIDTFSSYNSSAVLVVRYLGEDGLSDKLFLSNPEEFFHRKIEEIAYFLYEDSGEQDADANWFKARNSLVAEICKYKDVLWSGFNEGSVPEKL